MSRATAKSFWVGDLEFDRGEHIIFLKQTNQTLGPNFLPL